MGIKGIRVLLSTSEKSPVILYVRDIERLLLQSERIYNLFEKLLNKLSGSILVLGSRMLDANTEYEQADEHLTKLFPYNIDITPPQDETNLVNWNSQLEEDMKMIQFQDTRNHIAEVLAANDLAKQTTK
ncbi:Receptor-like kinase LIP1, partial [Bienertia sinuspersici]